MNNNYKILKTLEKKETRIVSLIEYKNKKAVLKELTTKNKSFKRRFNHEVITLISIKKQYIPKVYEYGDDFVIMEHIPAYENNPNAFSNYINDEIINKICVQLYDIKTTITENLNPVKYNLLLKGYKIVFKLWLNRSFQIYHLKALYLITLLYFKNKDLFKCNVSTKGDFTEVNILVTKSGNVKFIDFDNFSSKGFWLEDATYLLLHQDVELDKLKWQKEFFKIYLSKIKDNKMSLNINYIWFWFLFTSIIQYSIRFFQKQNNIIKFTENEVEIKENRILFFLDKDNFNSFLNSIKSYE